MAIHSREGAAMNANKDRMATIIIEQTATQWGIPLPEKSLNRRSTRKRATAKNPGRGKATHASLLLMAHIREVAHRRFSRCAALRSCCANQPVPARVRHSRITEEWARQTKTARESPERLWTGCNRRGL